MTTPTAKPIVEMLDEIANVPGGSFRPSQLAARRLVACGIICATTGEEAARQIERETHADSVPKLVEALRYMLSAEVNDGYMDIHAREVAAILSKP